MADESGAEHYVGDELELFQHCTNWKASIARQIRPFLGSRVLEVGAGLGGTTSVLLADGVGGVQQWDCLEPDAGLCAQIEQKVASGELPSICRARVGTLTDLDPDERYDTVLYVDVLEHIEDDAGEMRAAVARLAPGGRVVVLSPAYQWLFSPFDAAIGHYRRYSRRTLLAVSPPGARLLRFRYLDSVGVMASGANRFLMKQGMPTPQQLRFWDKVLVPMSRWIDPLVLHLFGKTVIGIWERSAEPGGSS